MTDEINVRLAGHSDYRAVMDINRDVYEGFDYLPTLYHQFLHCKGVIMVLTEKNGKVVAFVTFHLGPNEQSVLVVAGRTGPGHEGDQLILKMGQFLIENYPHINYIYSVNAVKGVREPNSSRTPILEQNIIGGIAESKSLRSLLQDVNIDKYMLQTNELTIQEAGKIDLVKFLPPKIFLGGVPNRVYQSDKDEILRVIRQHRTLITVDPSGRAVAFSYICTFQTKLGTTSEMYFHGGSDPDILQAHILMHCKPILWDIVKTPYYGIRIHFRDLPREPIRQFFTQVLGFEVKSVTGNFDVVSVENLEPYRHMLKLRSAL